MNILILEDDGALGKGIEIALSGEDREFTLCSSLADAGKAVKTKDYGLFILDVNLPDGSGADFCAGLRKGGHAEPVLMLTANDTELDTVAGFASGADDYVTKPFSLAVLRARIDALIRRAARQGGKVSSGDFSFDFENARFEKSGRAVELSKTEARLLQILFANKSRTVPREKLLGQIWPDGTEYVDENALSVAVRRLRSKLEDKPSNPRHILTVHGVGYKYE